MLNEIATKRIQKEIMDLDRDPPPGITCYPKDDTITDLEAYIKGPPDSPYEAGLFKLSIQIPDRYPFQPPQIKFVTSIYHPNIDDTGRICADILKMGEKGEWKPAINLSTALTSLRQLLAAPNPDDPLNADIAREYQLDHPSFLKNAQEYTLKYASEDAISNSEIKSYTEESTVEKEEEEKEEKEEKEEPIKKTKMSLSLSKRKINMSPVVDEDPNDALPKKVSRMKINKEEKLNTAENMNCYQKVTEKTSYKADKAEKLHKVTKNQPEKVNTEDVEVTKSYKENPVYLDSVTYKKSTEPIDPLLKKRGSEKILVNLSSKKLKTLVNHSHPPKETRHFPIEQQHDLSERKSLGSTSFNKNIIVLSDDDDDTYGTPVLHTLQLSKKSNRNKLSL
ncbi:hypothetical protein INT48_000579, partial [Thamnidium elegans]